MNVPLRTIPDADLDRTKYLGGSDAAGILGISPWRTPLDVYLDKVTPRSLESDPSKARVFARGKRMEPYVIDLLAEETGLQIIARGQRYIDPELDFLAAEIDAEAAGGENIEIKTVSPFKAKEWGEEQTDAIPVHYTAQAMHGLMVTGKTVCVFGVLIGGDDFRIYRVERDEETIAAMRQREVDFWQRVQSQRPPDPTAVSDIMRLFGADSGATLEASGDVLDAALRLQGIAVEAKALDAEAATLRERVQLAMRDASSLTRDGHALATWKTQTASRFDQGAFRSAHPDLFDQFKRASESRVFRLK